MAGVYCWQCGESNEDTSVCASCGAPVGAPAASPVSGAGATTASAAVTAGSVAPPHTAPAVATATSVAPPRTAPAVATATATVAPAAFPQAWPVISPEPVGDAILLARLEDEARAAARPVVPPRPSKARRAVLAVAITTIAMAVAGAMALTLGLWVRDGAVGGGGAFPAGQGPFNPELQYINATLDIPGGFLLMDMPITWSNNSDPSRIVFTRNDSFYGTLAVTALPSGNASLESFAQAAVRQEQSRIGDPSVVFGTPVAAKVMGLPALEFSADDGGRTQRRFIVVADAETQMMYVISSQADSEDATMADEIQAGIDSMQKV